MNKYRQSSETKRNMVTFNEWVVLHNRSFRAPIMNIINFLQEKIELFNFILEN